MKRYLYLLLVLISTMFWHGCIKEVSQLDNVEANNLIIMGELHHPNDYATVILKVLSKDNTYGGTTIEEATISLYKKTKDGKTTKMPVEFKSYAGNGLFISDRIVETIIGETYWITLQIKGREGEYKSAEETLLPRVPILGIEDNSLGTRVLFSDPKGTPNQYLVRSLFSDFDLSTEMITGIDTLFDGNESAYIEMFFSEGENGVQLSNISPTTYRFYKSMLEQADQNESYGDLENGDPSFLFRTPPPQLIGNIYNTQRPEELVLGNFGVFSNSFFNSNDQKKWGQK